MSIEILSALILLGMIVGLVLGIPIVFVLGTLAVVTGFLVLGPTYITLLWTSANALQTNWILVCCPLFILMGAILGEVGIAEELYQSLHQIFGRFRGGLAIATVVICTIFAAMSGVSAVSTLTMGLIALPAMLKRNYDKGIAIGAIASAGTLAILIPPSVSFIFFGWMAEASIGRLFMGGVLPGLMLSAMFCAYIAIRCGINPKLGPAIPREEELPWRQKLIGLRSMILPVILILLVLGTIYLGIATPTEAAGVGAFGALICGLVNRKLTWKILKKAHMDTIRVTAMAFFLAIAAKSFTSVYTAIGGQQLVHDWIIGLDVNRWVIMIIMQLILFVLGMVLDPLGIMFLTLPIFVPLVKDLGFDIVWFGILFVINMEMAYITPPFGWNLFYMKAVAPPSVSMGDIYKAIIPYCGVLIVGLALVMIWPQIAMWLPNMMYGK
jgi:tripartite ATP-independent transporter DctM subunit